MTQTLPDLGDVSVVIPCRNAGSVLAQTIRSVFQQRRPPREVIIVDDGSTDDSLRVALDLRAQFGAELRVFSETSNSAARTRNLGALAATGSALMFLDADDVLGPDALEALEAALRRQPDGVAICPWYRLTFVDGRWVQGPPSCRPRRPGEDPLSAWLTGWWHPPCSVLWSRTAFEGAGRWDELATVNDDGDLMMRAFAAGTQLVEASEGAAFYRRARPGHETLSGQRFSEDGLRSRVRVLEKVVAALEEHGRLAQHRPALDAALEQIGRDATEADDADVVELIARRREELALGQWASLVERAPETIGRIKVRMRRRLGAKPSAPASTVPTEVRFGLGDERSSSRAQTEPSAVAEPESLERPAVSVVLPTYQRAHLLPRAIDSVLAQTFRGFELIIVDDGSTDTTADVVARYDDLRIRYLPQVTNRGVSAARNVGLRAVRGDLIAFIDSDDEWLPDKLALQTSRMAELPHDVGLVYGGVEELRGGGVRTTTPSHRGDLQAELLQANVVFGGGSSVMMRRAVVATIGFFDERIPAIEDYDYWMRASRFFLFDFVDEPVMRYFNLDEGIRRSRLAVDNHVAREWFFRKHETQMRRHGASHVFLAESARRHLSRSDDPRAARRATLRAMKFAPMAPEVRTMIFRSFLYEPLRRSRTIRGARDLLIAGAKQPSREEPLSLRIILYSSTARNRPGGVQTVFRRLARGFRERGHAVSEVWGEAPNDVEGRGSYVELRLPERRSSVVGSARSVVGTARSSLRLLRSLVRTRPDVVNVHFARSELIHFLLLRVVFRFRLVVSVHGSDITAATGRQRERLGRLLARADAVTAVSPELAEAVTAMTGRDDVVLIPNGVDTDFWSPRPVSSRRQWPPTCVSVGRLAPDPKGQDVLLRAFATVISAVPDSRLLLVGDGPFRDELEGLTRDLGLDEAVTFTGNLDAEELRDLLRGADVFALASRREGLPMALLEAMAVGLPAIVTAVGSMAEVVVEGTGCVVPAEDPDALASALIRFLDDRAAAVGTGDRARGRANDFAASAVGDVYEALFERLVGCRDR